MGSPTEADPDGSSRVETFPDGTLVRAFVRRTTRDAYPSGWADKLHYGATESKPPQTLGDGTIRRYDNTNEDTNGHEFHAAPGSKPKTIEFPGMVELWTRFWSEIPKDEFEID